MNRFKGMLLGVALLALPAVAQAQTITFDDLGGLVVVPNGYAGFNWTYFNHRMDVFNTQYSPSGYQNAVVSGNFVAYNAWAYPVSLSRTNPFTFNGGWFTAAWNDGLQLDITGWNGSTWMFSETLTLTTSGPTWFAANWANIDALDFSSHGGVHHEGYNFAGDQFAMDDLQMNMNVVPEPASILLLGTGLAGIAGVIRRRRQKSTEN